MSSSTCQSFLTHTLVCTVLFKLGNKKKLFKHRARLDVSKYSFSNRIVDLWNSLPDSVISAETVFSFETRLYNYWKDQDILYKYESKINFKLQGNSQDEDLVL